MINQIQLQSAIYKIVSSYATPQRLSKQQNTDLFRETVVHCSPNYEVLGTPHAESTQSVFNSHKLHKIPFGPMLAILSILLCLGGPFVQPAVAQEQETLRVATKEVPPFVIQDGEEFTGFSIDLWEEIAQRIGIPYELQKHETVQELIQAVETDNAELAIAAISITSDREERIDFSMPMFASGLHILVSNEGGSFLTSVGALLSNELLTIIGIALLILIVMAHIIWLLERHKNPDFDPSYIRGIWEAFWWSSVTGTTTGYGDKVPRGVLGRLVTIIWMFTSVILLSYFTAAITTALTVQQLHGTISGPGDLPGHRVGTVEGTSSEDYLKKYRLRYRSYEDLDGAYTALEQGDIEAIVFDSPVLRYHSVNEGLGKVHLVGPMFREEYYGIVLPNNTAYAEEVNGILLQLVEDGTYNIIYEKWFGE